MAEVPRDKLANITGAGLGAAVTLAVVGIVAFVFPRTGDMRQWLYAAAILIGVVLILAVLLLAWKWFLKLKDKPFTQKLKQSAGATPNELTAVATRAKLDDLRRTFDAGIAKFKATGKDLYKLPWYLLVGEPGAGKTEAVRHSNLPFPPGLQDFLQGTGGTVNMNWWLTNQAVILDTAGRYMFEELQPGTAAEWTEFLRLLLKYRPQCPINGLILVIPANSLILDTADQIEAKAAKIAQQLDRIQRVLEVRFPVYVIVTKCDLVNGFREFFESLDDPQLQHQIMGWSNPDPLDQHFNPEQVEEHLKKVYARLSERRLGLLLDPVAHAGNKALRIDEVDSLYSFPDSFQKLGSRLRRYLALVFVAGEWSPKPLFLRGIYFTSSMREGQALDAELAELLRVPVESLRERRVWERERAYFLRDVLLKKAFPEKGLVTRAPNTRKAQRGRTVALLTTGFAAAIAILSFTIWGRIELNKSIDEDQKTFWSQVSQSLASDSSPDLRVLAVGATGAQSRLAKTVNLGEQQYVLGDFYASLSKWANRDVTVSPIFRPAALMLDVGKSGDINSKQKEDAGRIYSANVLSPIVVAARNTIEKTTRDSWDEQSTEALQDLVQFECGKPLKVAALFAYVTVGPHAKGPTRPANDDQQYIQVLESGSLDFCRPTKAPPDGYWVNVPKDNGAIEAGVTTLIAHCLDNVRKVSSKYAQLKTRIDRLAVLQSNLHSFCVELEKDPPKTIKAYIERQQMWTQKWQSFAASYNDDVKPLLKRLATAGAGQGLADLYRSENKSANDDAAKALRRVFDEFPAEQRPEERAIVSRKAREDLQREIKSFGGKSDEAIVANLSLLDTTLMGIATNGQDSRRIAEIVFDSYAKANSAMPMPSSSSTRSLSGTANATNAPLASTDQGPAGNQEAVKLAASDFKILRDCMVLPRQNYEAVMADLASLPDQASLLRQIEAAREGRAPIPRPVIPFYVPDKGDFDPKFDSDSAKKVVSGWLDSVSRIGSGIDAKGGQQVLDAPALRQQLSLQRMPIDQYVERYIAYWSAAFPTQGEKPVDWSNFRGQLPNPEVVNPAWRKLAITVADSLSWVSGVTGSPAKVRDDAIARANRIKSAYDDEKVTLSNIRNVYNKWLSLKQDSIGATRGALLDRSASDVYTGYIISADGDDMDRYWKDITLSLLKVLARQQDDLSNIASDPHLNGFPLKDSRRELSVEDLEQARNTFAKMALWDAPGTPNPQTVRGGSRIRTVDSREFDDELTKLAHGGIDETTFRRLTQMYNLLEALPRPGDTFNCTVEIPDPKIVARLQESLLNPPPVAVNQWNDFTLSIDGKNRDRDHRRQCAKAGLLGTLPWPGHAVEFDFYQFAQTPDNQFDPIPMARESKLSVWQCLFLVANYDPVVAGEDDSPILNNKDSASRKWYVRLTPRFANAPYSQWILLKFQKPIPHPSTWPK